MGELYQKTMDKRRYLEDLGYTYTCIWESEFDAQLKQNCVMSAFIDGLEMIFPLQPRDAFSVEGQKRTVSTKKGRTRIPYTIMM